MSLKKRVLIVGLFRDPEKFPVTQGSELANLLQKKGYQVLTVSRFSNRFLRIADIATSIILNAGKFDVGIVQFYSGNSLIWQHIAASLIKRLNKKLVITIHGGGVPEGINRYPKRYLPVLQKADAITCPSAFIIDKLSKYHFPLHLIENTIPLSKYPVFNKTTLKPVLLWMRAFSAIYNPGMAVKTVLELKQTYPSVKLFMGGPDLGSQAQVEQMIRAYKLEDNIEIVGFMDFDKKRYYAGIADIYLSTNKVDNAPVTFVEMWAMGLPVVSTNIGGIPYMIKEGVNGLLVDDDDHKAMAQKVIQLISSPELATRLIEHGKAEAKHYDEARVFDKWHALLTGL